jgi:hypothetical protein
MKRNIIIFTINWWAKRSSPAFLLTFISLISISCKKEGDFNISGKPQDSGIGIQFTDTCTLLNNTFLINDSLVSTGPPYLSFGGYNDASFTGKTLVETYCTLSLYTGNVDYSGTVVDSANLYMYYARTYGDTLSAQDFEVHQITTQLDNSIPYQTTSNFVTYNPAVAGEVSGVVARPYNFGNHSTIRIPLTNAFASTLLLQADDRGNTDFQSNFYGVMIKPKSASTGSVIVSDYSASGATRTRLTVYFKRSGKADSTVFMLSGGNPAFNRMITDRSGTPIASLTRNGDSINESITNNKCFIQAGTGVVTKVRIPYLKNLATVDGESVIINKATLIVPIDESSNIPTFRQVSAIGLLELNKDNTYKYRANGSLAFVQNNGFPQTGTTNAVTSGSTLVTDVSYSFDITSYVQSVLTGNVVTDGFIIVPLSNKSFSNRAVLNSSNASAKRMRLEIYYTKVK